MNSPNVQMLKVNGEYVTGPIVGTSGWGLAEYAVTDTWLEKMVHIGVFDYREVMYHSSDLVNNTAVILCDECADALEVQDECPSQYGYTYRAMRTTSVAAAKCLCFACKASKDGIPELMNSGRPMGEMTAQERHYVDEAAQWRLVPYESVLW